MGTDVVLHRLQVLVQDNFYSVLCHHDVDRAGGVVVLRCSDKAVGRAPFCSVE